MEFRSDAIHEEFRDRLAESGDPRLQDLSLRTTRRILKAYADVIIDRARQLRNTRDSIPLPSTKKYIPGKGKCEVRIGRIKLIPREERTGKTVLRFGKQIRIPAARDRLSPRVKISDNFREFLKR